MSLQLLSTGVLKWVGCGLLLLGFFLTGLDLATHGSPLSRLFGRYEGYLNRTMGLTFLEGSGRNILLGQAAAIIGIVTLELSIDVPYWYAALALAIVVPPYRLSRKRKEHIEKLELQLDGFILGLANSLKTVPSPAAALGALAPILQPPTKLEVDRCLKEMRVGASLEQALQNMSARIGSRPVESALSAVLIGIQVGGNLPTVLENTALTIREMNRLEGVVKTKTSEGRAQLWVLAAFPFVLLAAFNWVQPGYFDPLQNSFVGYIVVSIATAFWIGALLVARKVLAVDV